MILSENQKIQNRLISSLSNFKYEIENGMISEEELYSHFSDILLSANVDSKIIVKVLEDESFGELGKHQALSIKVNEGW